jgi:hypothetical protein
MKTLTTTLAATLFTLTATAVSAADVYHGLGDGNPDLASSHRPSQFETRGVTAVQPGVGRETNRYHGFADGNPDLFDVRLDGVADRDSSAIPDIYRGAAGNPDLAF